MATPIKPIQSRAARALIGWAQEKLALAAEVSFETVRNFELSRHEANRSTMAVIIRALEDEGIEFIPARNGKGVGVRLRDDT